MMKHLNKFFHLSWQDRISFAMALMLLPLTAGGVRLLGLKRYQNWLAFLLPLHQKVEVSLNQTTMMASNIAFLVRAATNHGFFRANCLQQSLVLWSLLRRYGIQADLRIGMQKADCGVKGHAWVEYCGTVLNDTPDVNVQFQTVTKAGST